MQISWLIIKDCSVKCFEQVVFLVSSCLQKIPKALLRRCSILIHFEMPGCIGLWHCRCKSHWRLFGRETKQLGNRWQPMATDRSDVGSCWIRTSSASFCGTDACPSWTGLNCRLALNTSTFSGRVRDAPCIWRFPKMGVPWGTPKASAAIGLSMKNLPF